MKAVRINGGITIDGRLDEPEWQLAEPARDFIQKLPDTGAPASEPTEVRILYDQENLYVGIHCFDSAGPDGIVVNDITRDFFTLDSDGFQIVIDTFNDNRNAFLFAANPAAGRFDMQIGNDGNAGNTSWDGIWYVETLVDEEGWHVEMAIPFKTLRFSAAEDQVWGVNFERRIRRKYEDSYWSPLPPQFRLGRVSLAGELDGVKGVKQGSNLYIKPYISAPLQEKEEDDIDFQPQAGLDVKYGLTSQLTLDLTLNTDFAQVEADEQRINLTRFSLFFPEKRDFFLENASIFEWGRRSGSSYRYRPDLLPFFSRRIGLTEDGEIVKILGGGRVTGRAGPYSIGALSMQTGEFGEIPSTNFTVARVRRDILKQSDVGGIFVNKAEAGGRYNRTYGADASFRFFNYLDLSGYVLKTDSPELQGNDMAGNFQVSWRDDFFDIRAQHLIIDDNFNPEVGFAPRTGIKKSAGNFAITPRPENISWIREIRPFIEMDYITNMENGIETRRGETGAMVILSDSSWFGFFREDTFERLEEDFEIQDGIFIRAGDYQFTENRVFVRSNRSKMISADARYSWGEFWDGTRESLSTGVTFTPSYRFSTELEWSHNDVEVSEGDFKTNLVTAKAVYAFNNRTFLNALIQYNTDVEEIASNIRFNFIHHPLSDFFLVYNERRSTTGEVIDWALTAKLTYLFAF